MVNITDHALLRWVERVHEVDVEKLRAEISAMVDPLIVPGVTHHKVGVVWAVTKDSPPQVVTFLPRAPKGYKR